MIYTLLYKSSLLHGNKNRNIIMYAIGTLIYVLIHLFLYSTLCDKYASIKAWRNLLYIVILGDIAYIKMQYDTMVKSTPRQQKQKPTIEPVDDVSKPNASTTPQEGKSIESIPVYTPDTQCNDGVCPAPQPTPVQPDEVNKETTDVQRISDVESIPEYEPVDNKDEKKDEDDVVEEKDEEVDDADEKEEK